MAEPSVPSTVVILKILSGVQSGVDVSLSDGDYSVGSSPDDDIQVHDVSLKPGHAKLRIAGGKVQLAGGQGSLHSNAGIDFPADGEYQELEPLDVVSAGATRFTTGLVSANWASITRDAARDGTPAPSARARKSKFENKPRRVVFGGAMVAAAIGGACLFWFFFGNHGAAQDNALADTRPAVERVKDAVAKLMLAHAPDISRAVDGVIFVTGFTENPAERRAIQATVQDIDPNARVRLTVLETTRVEIAALLSSNYPDLGFTLSDRGELTLSGIELDPVAAKAAVDLVRDRVSGLSSITSAIRTSETLLLEAQQLSERSRLQPLLMLRLDGALIEATGVLPTDKIDAWVGFLQAYSTNLASIIPLRSFVNLQNANGEIIPMPEGPALVLGKNDVGADERKVDVERLASGQFSPEDLFSNRAAGGNVGAENRSANADGGMTDALGNPVVVSGVGTTIAGASGALQDGPIEAELNALAGQSRTGNPTASDQNALQGSSKRLMSGAQAPGAVDGMAIEDPAQKPIPVASPDDTTSERGNRDEVEALLRTWTDRGGDLLQKDGLLLRGLSALQEQLPSGVRLQEQYRPLSAGMDSTLDQACWAGSQITPANAPSIVFWLDMISVSDKLTLADLRRDIRGPVLEAGLNPRRIGKCISQSGGAFQSVYLKEVERNPDFINFVVRSLSIYPLDVVGADVTANRYIQIRNGDKLLEGSAPDRNSRISVVGELGVAVRVADSFSVVIFGKNVSWLLL
ncbi:MAG: FHA domain-containing protein [Allorhizobium sp.]